MQQPHETYDIPTQIKNPDLVKRRRRQIIDAAVKLFINKGFHKTTTRQIARAAELSIGALYEYVSSKEDVLYMVCNSIHMEVEHGMSDALARAKGGRDALKEVIREYFMVCHRMSDFILLIYQETQSLPSQWQKKVLENELRITGLFIKVLNDLISSGNLPRIDERSIELVAHNISVLGHMWTFRRWFLANNYSIEDYIELQTKFILGIFTQKTQRVKPKLNLGAKC
ncbi:MAG: TetR/AcrR family transcriptional regulator [Thermodesulfobacteriota bacterium]|nr:TetR/AcrR family transcriptional regulator [Thermodesulfobacteriota bacterium]